MGFLCRLLSRGWEDYKLTVFRIDNRVRLGPLSSPTALIAHDKEEISPCSRCITFWFKPSISIFGLFALTMFIEHLHMLTLLLTLVSFRPDADRYIFPLRF